MSDVEVPRSARSGHLTSGHTSIWTIVVAGGSGQRFGSMKQFENLDGRRILDHAVEAACVCSDGIVIVVPIECVSDEIAHVATRMVGTEIHVVGGGASRAASVRSGLGLVPSDAEIVVVHDAARPFASSALFGAVIDAVRDGADGAIPGLAMVDTVKVIDASGHRPRVVVTPDRATLVSAQTPQAFRAPILRHAHADGAEGTDDASLVEAIGGTVVVVPGEVDNRKITQIEDLAWARAHVSRAHVSRADVSRADVAQSLDTASDTVESEP